MNGTVCLSFSFKARQDPQWRCSHYLKNAAALSTPVADCLNAHGVKKRPRGRPLKHIQATTVLRQSWVDYFDLMEDLLEVRVMIQPVSSRVGFALKAKRCLEARRLFRSDILAHELQNQFAAEPPWISEELSISRVLISLHQPAPVPGLDDAVGTKAQHREMKELWHT